METDGKRGLWRLQSAVPLELVCRAQVSFYRCSVIPCGGVSQPGLSSFTVGSLHPGGQWMMNHLGYKLIFNVSDILSLIQPGPLHFRAQGDHSLHPSV